MKRPDLVRGLGGCAVAALAAVGAALAIWTLIIWTGIVKAPEVEAVYRSPDRRSAISWIVADGETRPRSLDFPESGLHLFEPAVSIVTGEPYFARWTSNRDVDLFVSQDFAIEGSTIERSGFSVHLHFVANLSQGVKSQKLSKVGGGS